MRGLTMIAAALASAPACAAAPAEDPVSCRAPPRTDPDSSSAAYRRHNQVQSDSLWLIQRVRRLYPDRLAAAYVAGRDDPADLALIIRLTGTDPVPPMRLGDRARGVPVIVRYGAPHSLRQVEAIRREADGRVAALLPTLQGVGYDERDGMIDLVVYAPDAAAERQALAQCDALRALYRMPVRIEITDATMELHGG